MQALLFSINLAIGCYLLYTIFEFNYGFKQLKNLSSQPALDEKKLPCISIILSALNEEKHIEQTLVSLLNLNYPCFEVIAVNDRSTDNTPDILNKLQQSYPHLQVQHIQQLPPGWFGKNHALHYASQHAKGEWLLFTDADVLMKKDSLTKAISYALENNVDHLTLYEHHVRKNFWLKILLLGTYVTYSIAMKPWRVRHAWSKRSLGHGAFNLIKKQVYQQCDGHRAIAMECLDDLKLGEWLKKNGFRQDVVNGKDFIEREWYSSLQEMIVGMEKNSFAFFNYRLLSVCRDVFFLSLLYFLPLIIALFFSGSTRLLSIINIIFMIIISIQVASQFRMKKYYAFLYPFSAGLLIYMVCNSVIAIYKNKGIIWRGTLYPLKNLRKKSKGVHLI